MLHGDAASGTESKHIHYVSWLHIPSYDRVPVPRGFDIRQVRESALGKPLRLVAHSFDSSQNLEEPLESVVHVHLLMAVKEGEARRSWSEVHVQPAKAIEQYHIFPDPRGCSSVDAR